MGLTLEQPTSTVIDGVSWETYRRLRDEAGPETRITFDDGRMEIMAPISGGHASRTGLLRQLAETYMRSAAIGFSDFSVVTLARDEVRKACEGDQMYYVRAEPPPPGTEQLDLSIHNPPDLVIEVDLSNSSIPKEPIYAAVGVVEVWRWAKNDLTVCHLRADKSGYDDSARSALLPDLPVAALAEHVRLGRKLAQHEVVARWSALLRA